MFQSLEAKKMADWSAKASKIEEIARKKDELHIEFVNQTKEALDAKMEHHVEKRDALMTDMKKKLKVGKRFLHMIVPKLFFFILNSLFRIMQRKSKRKEFS